MALPGRDDTTRGAGDTGAEGETEGAPDGGTAGEGGVAGEAAGAVGGVTTLVTTLAGGNVDTGEVDAGAVGAVSTVMGAVGAAASAAAGCASSGEAFAFVVFFARETFGVASSVAAFLVRFGFSTIGSRFKPFSSA